jgi:predicted dehydrogenase
VATAERLVALARESRLVLAEATTYAYHPVVAALREVCAPRQVTVTFTPPVPATDFRHRRERGGGAISDLGPYFASIGRLLFDAAPDVLDAICERGPEVETAFSVLARYPSGGTLVGQFGFTAPYRNWVHVAAPGVAAEVTGIFSTPPEATTTVAGRDIAPASAMRLFVDSVLAAIARGDTTTHSEHLLADARVVAELRRKTR